MSSDDHYGFSANKIFIWLFIYTAAEVGWGYLGHTFEWPKLIWWGGLVFFALLKGFLILAYFMHFKFEGWIVKGLIAPTPILIVVVLAATSPDVSYNDKLDHHIGAMYVPEEGRVSDYMEDTQGRGGHGEHGDEDESDEHDGDEHSSGSHDESGSAGH